jgi:hypothetical protein
MRRVERIGLFGHHVLQSVSKAAGGALAESLIVETQLFGTLQENKSCY